MRRRGLSGVWLFARQVLADRGAALIVMVTVLLVAGTLAAWPRAVEQMLTDSVRESLADRGPRVRDLVAVVQDERLLASSAAVAAVARSSPEELPDLGRPSVDDVWGFLTERLDEVRADMAPPLHDVTADARTVASVSSPVPADDAEPHPELHAMQLSLVGDLFYADEVTFVAGEAPQEVGFSVEDAEGVEEASAAEPHGTIRTTVEIALSAGVADRFRWDVGDTRVVDGGLGPVELVLVGAFEAVDADADYWQHVSAVLDPQLEHTDPGIVATAQAYVAPELIGHAGVLGDGVSLRTWYPLSGAGLRAADVEPLLQQLRTFNAEAQELLSEAGASNLTWSLEAVQPLEEAHAAQVSAWALIMMVAVGPAGVALTVLALATRLVAVRGGRTLTMAAARGASTRQLRGLLAAKGILLGLIPAVAAVAIVDRTVPGLGGLLGWLVPILVGLTPAALLVLTVRPPRPTGLRAGSRTRRRRWLGRMRDGLAIGAAVVSVALFQRRGLDPVDGTDPLLVLTPLLVIVAVCVVVLRIYPVVLRFVTRALSRRSGAVAFVGSARAGREAAAAAAPVLALVVGLSIAVFSSVLWSTTQRGAEAAAWHHVGADLRASSSAGFAADAVTFAREAAGVVEAAEVDDAGLADLRHGETSTRVRLFVADTAALERVQEHVPNAPMLPAGLAELTGQRAPAVVSAGLLTDGTDAQFDTGLRGDDVPVVAASTAAALPGLSGGQPWVLVDREAWQAAGGTLERPRVMLIRAAGEVDGELLAEELGTNAPLLSPADRQEQYQEAILAGGLSTSFLVSVGVAGVLAATALVLTMALGGPTRVRLLSVLRTVGLSGRQAHGLVVWEVAPLALLAMACGLTVGVALPGLVVSGVDLRPFTGGQDQPTPEPDYALVGLATAAFAGLVVVAVTLAVLAGRQARLGQVLRVGEER